MEKQLGLATFFPPSAQAVRVSEPGILTYWRNQPFTVLPDDYSGKLEIRYADGAVFLTADFSEGRADGRLSIFYSDGILLSEENYVQGRLEGDIQLLYQSGIPAYSYSFKAGVCQGQYLSYNRSGEILSTFDCN
jgi:antitoxin component YwqK of YwqJK toxin-antitoxin module